MYIVGLPRGREIEKEIMRKKSVLMIGAVTIVVALGGCKTLDKLEREGFQRKCDNLGIARNTPMYSQCMLQQQAIEEQATQRSLDRIEAENLVKKNRR